MQITLFHSTVKIALDSLRIVGKVSLGAAYEPAKQTICLCFDNPSSFYPQI